LKDVVPIQILNALNVLGVVSSVVMRTLTFVCYVILKMVIFPSMDSVVTHRMRYVAQRVVAPVQGNIVSLVITLTEKWVIVVVMLIKASICVNMEVVKLVKC
jgi:hypothetical protein